MKTLEQFETFYSTDLLQSLEELEKDRKSRIGKVIRNFFIYIGLAILVVLLGFVVNNLVYGTWFDDFGDNVPVIIGFILPIIGIVGLFIVNNKQRKEFTVVFKEKIIKKIVEFINPELKYSPEGFISSGEFCKSEIFRQYPDRYNGDDLVSGKIDKTDISFSEIHAKYKTESSDDNGKKEQWHKLFDGLFFVADFHKNFKGKYFVLPDFAEKTFGSIGKFFQKMTIGRGQLIHLEDPEFEKEFAVYGNDQVEARYILSSNMMRRMLDFKNRTAKNIYISFVDSSIYVAIPYSKPLFEPKFFSSVLNQKKTSEYFEDLNLVISIVEDLNLNTRIWGKE